MGQQQLLLIVLGVIIVGIAVVVGINVFTVSSANSNRDAVISDLTTLAAMSQQYYRKPTAMGGGGNTFTGWTIPTSLQSTANGSYDETVTATAITLVGTGNELGNDGSDSVQVTMVVGPNQITSTTINN
jgi:Tfp pilus assembly protein PilE